MPRQGKNKGFLVLTNMVSSGRHSYKFSIFSGASSLGASLFLLDAQQEDKGKNQATTVGASIRPERYTMGAVSLDGLAPPFIQQTHSSVEDGPYLTAPIE